MNPVEMKRRTMEFGLRAVKLVERLPNSIAGQVFSRQILRSASGVGANYRAACRTRTKPEFVYKIGLAEEEADESDYRLETILRSKLSDGTDANDLLREANELTAILTASGRTAKRNR